MHPLTQISWAVFLCCCYITGIVIGFKLGGGQIGALVLH